MHSLLYTCRQRRTCMPHYVASHGHNGIEQPHTQRYKSNAMFLAIDFMLDARYNETSTTTVTHVPNAETHTQRRAEVNEWMLLFSSIFSSEMSCSNIVPYLKVRVRQTNVVVAAAASRQQQPHSYCVRHTPPWNMTHYIYIFGWCVACNC